MTRMLVLAFSLALAAGCSKPTPAPAQASTQHQPSARAFVDHLLAALEHRDLAAWKPLLSTRMRDTLSTDDLAQNQLDAWRRDVLPLARALRTAELAVSDRTLTYTLDGSEPVALAQVAIEGGALKLDEN